MKRLRHWKLPVFASALIGLFTAASVATAAESWSVIVDEDVNDGAGFSFTTSNWVKRGGGYGGYYRYLSSLAGDKTRQGTATWETTIPYCGTYTVKVSAYKTENRTGDADFYYTSDYDPSTGGSGTESVSLSQIAPRSVLDWDTIGTFYYEAGQTVKVTLDGTDDGASDCADAVSWTLVKTETCRSTRPAGGGSSMIPTNFLLLKK